MVRPHSRQKPKERLSQLLNEDESSSDDDDINQSAQQHKSQQSATTSKAGENSKKNQPSTSKANQEKPTGASKRKPKSTKRMNALFQICDLQKTVQNLIPRSPFCRCVKEVLNSLGNFRMTKDSLDALQEAAEAYMVGVFGDAYRLTLHRARVTILPSDIQLLMYLRGSNDPGVP